MPIAWSRLRGQGLRFLIAGGAAAVLYVATTTELANGLGAPFQLALLIGFAVAVCTHFVLQRVFVWRHQAAFELRVRQQVARYAIVAGAQYGLTAASTRFLPAALGRPVTLVYVVTVVLVSALNFLVFRRLVFHAAAGSDLPADYDPLVVADPQGTGVWPKQLPDLSREQRLVREQFVARWLEVLPKRYGRIEEFNHRYPLVTARGGRTLEIGAGLGEHLRYEDLDRGEYFAVDLREELAAEVRSRYPGVTTLTGDCQERLPFDDGHFDRVVAIHVLEHLPDLPRALDEVSRLLADDGRFVAVIPCEGGAVYSLARRVSAQRLFEREFGMSYDWFVRSEHVNVPWEILSELRKRFSIEDSRYFPFRIPSVELNLVIGVTLRPLTGTRVASAATV